MVGTRGGVHVWKGRLGAQALCKAALFASMLTHAAAQARRGIARKEFLVGVRDFLEVTFWRLGALAGSVGKPKGERPF